MCRTYYTLNKCSQFSLGRFSRGYHLEAETDHSCRALLLTSACWWVPAGGSLVLSLSSGPRRSPLLKEGRHASVSGSLGSGRMRNSQEQEALDSGPCSVLIPAVTPSVCLPCPHQRHSIDEWSRGGHLKSGSLGSTVGAACQS